MYITAVYRQYSLLKNLYFFENGVAGAKPPTGTRGGSPSNIAPSHGEGVWGFGKDAEIERPKALQDAKPTKRSYRDREFALFFIKTYFFYNLKLPDKTGCFSYIFSLINS